jgi:hypothetical protein
MAFAKGENPVVSLNCRDGHSGEAVRMVVGFHHCVSHFRPVQVN